MLTSGSIESGSVDLPAAFDKENDQRRVETLYKKDPLYPAVLAARNALRVLPMIAAQGNVDFWFGSPTAQASDKQQPTTKKHTQQAAFEKTTDSNEITKPKRGADKRAVNMLAIFLAPQTVIQQFTLVSDERDLNRAVTANAANAANANTANTKATHVNVANVANANASIYYAIYDTATGASAANVAYAVALTADAALTIVSSSDELAKVIEQELSQAEQNTTKYDWLTAPLWPSLMPEDLASIYQNKFIPVVNELIKHSADTQPQAVEALTRLLSNYDALVKGQDVTSLNHFSHNGGVASENSQQRGDQLGRKKLVGSLSQTLTHEDNNEHLTIGLLGHWGTGKTRILELLKDNIQARSQTTNSSRTGFLFGEFNAWAYEHAKNNQAAMAHEIIKSLTSFQQTKEVTQDTPELKKLWYGLRNHSLTLLWKIFIRSRITFGFMARKYPIRLILFSTWLGLISATVFLFITQTISVDSVLSAKGNVLNKGLPLACLFGLWRIIKDAKVLFAQTYTKELLSYIKLPDYAAQIGEISEMREDIRLMANIRLGTQEPNCKDWLGKVLPPKRLLFVVDDLDRCGPDGIVKTFEAIRLVLDIPQVFVVIAVDQRIALAALALHYEKLSGHHQLNDAKAIARDYLAKMIQLPIVVNDGDATTLEGYLSHLWQDKEGEADKWLSQLRPDRYAQKTPDDPPTEEAEHNLLNTENVIAEPEGEERSKLYPLSDKKIIEHMLNLPDNSAKQEINEFTGLQPEHKAAFAYWAQRFELTNARQIKRLYNSYNLIRLVSGYEDQLCEGTEERFAYGVLVALLAIEFVNGIEDAKHREVCVAFLRKKQGVVNPVSIQDTDKASFVVLSAAREVIDLAAQQRFEHVDSNKRYHALLNSVELFVLPAIDSFDTNNTKSS